MRKIIISIVCLFALISCEKEVAKYLYVSDDRGIKKLETEISEIKEVETTSATCIVLPEFGGDGEDKIGVVLGLKSNPDLNNNSLSFHQQLNSAGSFTFEMTDLLEGTSYYIRSYISNTAGIRYSEELRFSTKEVVRPELEIMYTNKLSVDNGTALVGAKRTFDGRAEIINQGIVWSTSSNPSLDNYEGIKKCEGEEEYSLLLENLQKDKVYYYRAFASNYKFTGYSEVQSFAVRNFDEMVYVRGGAFLMGSEEGTENEKPVHNVGMPSFFMGKYEVTQAFWFDIMGTNPSDYLGANCPVTNVSWNEVQEFIKKLNQKTGLAYRLPTEAEWEYAARGGNYGQDFLYSGSNILDEVGWFGDNAGGHIHPVGKKKENELGIHDMSGNVKEWCSDGYNANYYSISPDYDPTGDDDADTKVLRGGYENNIEIVCRVYYRDSRNPSYSRFAIGFRLARSMPVGK